MFKRGVVSAISGLFTQVCVTCCIVYWSHTDHPSISASRWVSCYRLTLDLPPACGPHADLPKYTDWAWPINTPEAVKEAGRKCVKGVDCTPLKESLCGYQHEASINPLVGTSTWEVLKSNHTF